MESGEGGGIERASHDAGHYARPPGRVAIIHVEDPRVAELVPAPFPHLLRRMLREWEHERKVFDLPARRFWRGSDDLDTSVVVHGHRAANPVGPAAGPHGQMAQNVLLSWLAGGRFIELKTVQVNDRLTIPRPCIDMETVGYNVEWSQELRLAESLREYVKGSMLIDVARATGLLGRPDDPARDDTILDLSLGYDLAGVRSPAVRSWVESMKDARAEVEALRDEIPDEHRRLRDLEFRTTLSDQVTLSTFHGCPAGEIEAMAAFLMEEMGLHVTVKLNPTLLGKDAVDGLLHDVLGYTEVETRAEDFEKDLQWPEALEMTDRLTERARALGREFRLKLSNTLVVRNHRSFFPPGEAAMYLSGAPLHVITLHLVERVRRARPELPLSFSAGVDARNFADCVALGLAPVTVCTDLLKPGGYGRLPRYLENLEERMRRMGVRTRGRLRGQVRRQDRGGDGGRRGAGHRRSALPGGVAAPAAQDRPAPRALRLHQLRQVPARLPERRQLRLRGPAAREGVRELQGRRRPGRARHGRPLRGAREPPDRHLPGLLQRLRQLRHVLPRGRRPLPREAALLRLARGLSAPRRPRRLLRREARERRPAVGAPAAAWSTGSTSTATPTRPSSRTGASPWSCAIASARRSARPSLPGAPDGHTLDVGAYLKMAVLLDGVLDPRHASPVSV